MTRNEKWLIWKTNLMLNYSWVTSSIGRSICRSKLCSIGSCFLHWVSASRLILFLTRTLWRLCSSLHLTMSGWHPMTCTAVRCSNLCSPAGSDCSLLLFDKSRSVKLKCNSKTMHVVNVEPVIQQEQYRSECSANNTACRCSANSALN